MAIDISFRPPTARRGGSHLYPLVVTAGTVTASATTEHFFPPAMNLSQLESARIQCDTVVADSNGTVLATICKRRASDNARIALTAALDLELLTSREVGTFVRLDLPAKTSVIDPTIGDSMYLEIVSSSSIDTAATQLVCTAEMALRR